MPDGDIHELLLENLEHPRWDDVAERCLTCGNCTMVCPTCFCTSVEDTSDLTGTETSRERRWDSCFTMDFSYIHGGSVRSSGRSRYRQWMTHKLATWFDQFGIVRLRRLRAMHHLVPGRHRHHRGSPRHPGQGLKAEGDGRWRWKDWNASSGTTRSSPGSTSPFWSWSAAARRTCGSNAGKYLFREGGPADQLYLIREGRVALEIAAPGSGAVTFQTVGEGEIVGISWLFPPYRWTYDARAVERVRAIGMDATCLRNKCEADHSLGYDVMKRLVPILFQRLQATRLQVLDVYGKPAA